MATVFTKDLLFIHVMKTGGTSVTHFLLQQLPRPVYYIARAKHSLDDGTGFVYIHGKGHQRLGEAQVLLRPHGFDVQSFPLILAIVRNPYDMLVSYYAWQRRRDTMYEVVDGASLTIPPVSTPEVPNEIAAAVAALVPGKVVRIEPGEGESIASLRDHFHRAAIRAGRPVESWATEGAFYSALHHRPLKVVKSHDHAQKLDFRQFLLATAQEKTRPFLVKLYDYYHLDGVMPENMRILRFESLGDDLRSALDDAGLATGATLPWLNRSDRGAYADYYDAETEEEVYHQARWLFDRGFYPRLDLNAND